MSHFERKIEIASTFLKNQLRQSIYKDDIKRTKSTGVQSTHSCAAWPWTKQSYVFKHGHLPEIVLSISTCFSVPEVLL